MLNDREKTDGGIKPSLTIQNGTLGSGRRMLRMRRADKLRRQRHLQGERPEF
jgi:hypothetical protein